MRSFLEALAEKIGFDPLVAENWYSISRLEFVQHRVSPLPHLSFMRVFLSADFCFCGLVAGCVFVLQLSFPGRESKLAGKQN